MGKRYFKFTEKDIVAGKYSAWDLIEPLWETVSIYDGIDVYNADLSPFNKTQRLTFAMLWYDAEVNNGGHDQFFFNSTGIVWKDALEGMKMIEAHNMAINFQKAIDMFGVDVPFDRDERGELLDKLYEDDDFPGFEEIDSTYYKGDDMGSLLDEYVKKHASEFVIDGEFDCFD